MCLVKLPFGGSFCTIRIFSVLSAYFVNTTGFLFSISVVDQSSSKKPGEKAQHYTGKSC